MDNLHLGGQAINSQSHTGQSMFILSLNYSPCH